MLIHHGMNRGGLDRILKTLGGEVLQVTGTGDIRYSHPKLAQQPRANGRRKDAPRSLTTFVLKVAAACNAEANHG